MQNVVMMSVVLPRCYFTGCHFVIKRSVILLIVVLPSIIMLDVSHCVTLSLCRLQLYCHLYAECLYAECHHAKRYYNMLCRPC
jgi:hypothetical protein